MTGAVLIVGAGPVGLWLASELQLAGVRAVVLERRSERDPHSKALTIHPRTVEVFAMRGVADRFVDEAVALPSGHFGALESRLDFSVLDTDYQFTLMQPQARTEELLEELAVDAGATILRNHEVTAMVQRDDGIVLHTRSPDGEVSVEGDYVVGCDGVASTIRRLAEIDFPGTDSDTFGFLGDVVLDNPPEQVGLSRSGSDGLMMVVPMPGGFHRFVGVDAHGQDAATTELGFDEFRSAIARIAGSDFGMRDPVWLSRFGNATRQAATYRTGRVMLAGDAAHMHFPTGGVGMNVGLQDAMNLGWKLAAVVNGVGGVGLLDSYHRERHPVGTDLLENSLAQTAVIAGVSHSGLGLRAFLNRLIGSCPELSRTLAERLAALHVSYPPEDPSAHAAVGRRAPNLGATDSDLFQSLRPGKPVLVSSADGPVDVDAELSVVRQAAADGEKPDWLPVEAALIRPDGHVAWATDSAVGADEVRIALNSMFERPTTSS